MSDSPLPRYEIRWHYDVYLWEISDSGHSGLATECEIAFGTSREIIQLHKDFEAWAMILTDYNDAYEYFNLSRFDWDSFNAAGLALAKRLKQILGLNRHIQYSKCILDKDCYALVWESPAGKRT